MDVFIEVGVVVDEDVVGYVVEYVELVVGFGFDVVVEGDVFVCEDVLFVDVEFDGVLFVDDDVVVGDEVVFFDCCFVGDFECIEWVCI